MTRTTRFLLLAAASVVLAGCVSTNDDPREAVEAYVGDMADFSYAGTRDYKAGQNAMGQAVSFADFEGKFLWVDYAAPWCAPCTPQAQQIRALESSQKDVVFLTVLTAGNDTFTTPTRGTARAWAQRFRLNSDRVIAANRHLSWVIPQHFLFSPSGQTLYRHKGMLPAAEIKKVIAKHKRTWVKEHDVYESDLSDF